MYAKEIGLKNTNESASKSDMYYVETDPTGRYGRLDEVLGRGAMKTVYKAIDEEVGMEVAWNQVKLNQVLCSPQDLERLYSEVHLLNTLSHPSVIEFYTCWIDLPSKSFNFVTEMFTSGTLREYRNKYKRVKMEAIKKWARQILEGLEYLHSHDPPVIHRDLKCDNIFVNGHLGQLKLGDFGLAAVLRASHSAHSVIGTPEFMAPELYEEEYNELVDVYSFGMCMIEMLTCEYPYSECANPAQIYKKVTSGKLPLAYYRIDDIEAQRFIGKCLVPACKRLSAKQLLLDPFLSIDELQAPNKVPFLNYTEFKKLQLGTRTNMTITGKLNPQHDTIFLKVQIADQDGSMRNIYFPFDIQHDTATDVAMEMVKELDIHDWEPFEIAEMIDSEIQSLVPSWKTWDQLGFHDYPDHPCSSSSSSLSESIPDHLQGIPVYDDETTSQSSGSYSNLSYISGEDDIRRPDKRAIKTRFCPRDNSGSYVAFNQSKADPNWKHDGRKLTRNRSLVDVRSQLLHRSLVEEVNKRRLFKTVGDVENVGFQAPKLDNKTVRRLVTKNNRMK